jgi:hypothetical protein
MRITLEEIAYRVLPRVSAGRALSDSEWRTLVRAAQTLLEGSAVPIAAERVADNVERFLCTGQSRRTWRVRVLLELVEYLPLVHGARSFSRLAPAQRRHWVTQRWITGRGLHGVCARVRLLVMMGAYGDCSAFENIGFVPVPLRARLQRHAPAQSRASRVVQAPLPTGAF